MPAAIEWGKLAELLYVAPLAAIVVSVTYALVILGTGRSADARRDGAVGAAVGFAALAVVGGLGFLAVVVYAFVQILDK